jgi:hypothetical protein
MAKSKATVVDFMKYLKRSTHIGGIMNGVGLCAVFSQQGDWAFDYALGLARHYRTKLNIFHFLESPYMLRRDVVFVDAEKKETAKVTPTLIAKMDKQMREMFDDRLGDYVDVGFRLCEGNDEFELRRCFKKGDYEILVIGYNGKGAAFGGTTTIEEFTAKFKGPVVLVGPDSPDSYCINGPAEQRVDELLLLSGKWKRIEEVRKSP